MRKISAKAVGFGGEVNFYVSFDNKVSVLTVNNPRATIGQVPSLGLLNL